LDIEETIPETLLESELLLKDLLIIAYILLVLNSILVGDSTRAMDYLNITLTPSELLQLQKSVLLQTLNPNP
jgi:hypothetical protein